MYKLVFVDDEALVKMGLTAIVDWNAFGFDIVGEAKDGEEGLQLIERYNPDLVITDIVMPVLDGLEMIKKAGERGKKALFVVLSSYDEFGLVKKAMKLGAKDYILKMKISNEVVSEVLRDVLKELDLNNNYDNSGKSSFVKSNWELETLRNSFFTNLLSERYLDSSSLPAKTKELEIHLEEDSLRIAYVITDVYAKEEKQKDINKKVFELTIRDIIKDICNEFFECYCLQWEDGKYLIAFSDYSDSVFTDAADNLQVMLEAIIEMLKQYGNINASIGVSEKISGFINLNQAYVQAKSVLDNLFADGYGRILFYNRLQPLQKREMSIESWDDDNLRFICESCDGEKFKLLYEKIAKELEGNFSSHEKACGRCSKFLCFVEDSLSCEWMEYGSRKNIDNDMYKIYHCSTVDELRQVFCEFCGTVYCFMEERKKDDTYVLVREAKKYIKEHRYTPITLKEVADHLHISAGYLSGIFSKFEEMGFANYVNKIKILEAKRLLKQEHLKIYEVSFRLGYENSSYFSKIFKKYTGHTPKEYLEIK